MTENPHSNYRTAHGAPPPLPNYRRVSANNNSRGGLHSERGLGSAVNQQIYNASGIQGGGSHRPQDNQHYQSTAIEQNVMMFDQEQQSQAEALQMSSAFDHIQDELAKLGDQLNGQPDEAAMRIPRSTKASNKRNSRMNSRNGGSRSASRSRQQEIMSRLANGQRSTTSSNGMGIAQPQQQKTFNSTAEQQPRGNNIRTHARLSSTQSNNKLQQQNNNQESQRSFKQVNTLQRKKSSSSVKGANQHFNGFQNGTNKVKRAYETLQVQENPQPNKQPKQQMLGNSRSRSQRSFTNLPVRRLSRARSKSTKALGSQRSVNHPNYYSSSNMTQPIITRKTQNNISRVYNPQYPQHLNHTTTNNNMQQQYPFNGGINSTMMTADQTMIQAPAHYRQNTDGSCSLVNILTSTGGALEPPQYLVAQPCLYNNNDTGFSNTQDHSLESSLQKDSQQHFQQPQSQQPNSQIEQIMARYEQLCKKLDLQQVNHQSSLQQQQFQSQQSSVQQQTSGTETAQFHQMRVQGEVNEMGGSLDMYIAQHEESMMQESGAIIDVDQQSQQLVTQQTLDSPARHIGPREYIEQQIILSNTQQQRLDNNLLVDNHEGRQLFMQTGSFEDQQQIEEQNNNINNQYHEDHPGEKSHELIEFAENEALVELQARMINNNNNQESDINLADGNHLVTASQFNQLSQVTDKEGTSHFQGIALTTSELNNYQDSHGMEGGKAENKENDDQFINVKESQVTNTQQTSKNGFNQNRSAAAISGQHTHGQASVTSYNTADFTKLSINQNEVLSNQKSSKGVNNNAAQQQQSQHPYQLPPYDNAMNLAMKKLQSRTSRLESGLKSAMQIILQLGQQLNDVQGMDPLSSQLTEHVDELETIDSVVDLLTFMRNDKRNLLVRNPQIQRVVQNSFHLFNPQATQQITVLNTDESQRSLAHSYSERQDQLKEQLLQQAPQPPMEASHQQHQQSKQSSKVNNNVVQDHDFGNIMEPSSVSMTKYLYQEHHNFNDAPITDSDSKVLLQLQRQSSSQSKNNHHNNNHRQLGQKSCQATSPPNQRCATEMSALIGSPVGVLDLSAVNQLSQVTPSAPVPQGGDAPPSMDTVKLVGVGAYNLCQPFETANNQPNHKKQPTMHERINSQHVQAQADGQLLTLRNQKIFEADESNIFSQTMSPNAELARRQANMVTHLFSQEEESSISHQKTSGRRPATNPLASQQENQDQTGRTTNTHAELSFDSVFSKEQRAQNPQLQQQLPKQDQQQLPAAIQDNVGANGALLQGYSPVILNRVQEISPKKVAESKKGYRTATFVEANRGSVDQSSISESSARSSVFNAANQSLSQQELSDIMFASVRNPANLVGFNQQQKQQQQQVATRTDNNQVNSNGDEDGSNVGILTAMAQKRRVQQQTQQANNNNSNNARGNQNTGNNSAPWKSLNLSKLNVADQNMRDRFAPMGSMAQQPNTNLGLGGTQNVTKTAENRRQRCYNNDDEQEDNDQDLEQASRLLTLDDFAPNFVSQKPFSPQSEEGSQEETLLSGIQNSAFMQQQQQQIQQQPYRDLDAQIANFDQQKQQMTIPQQQQNYSHTTHHGQQQTLVSFRRMTNRGADTQSSQQSNISSHADRVAAALVMSSGPAADEPPIDDGMTSGITTSEYYQTVTSGGGAAPQTLSDNSLINQSQQQQQYLNHSGLTQSGMNQSGAMNRIEDARSKFLGGFTSLKSEISQLKQTILND